MIQETAVRRQAIAARELLFCFTSLGDNCEFGLVQRRAGAEPLGLFRLAFSETQALIESVQDGFADLDPLTMLAVEQPWGEEYITRFGTRGFYRHTRMYPGGSVDPAKLRQDEGKRIPFLRRRLLEDLQAADTFFVRKSNEHAPAEMMALYQAMRRYGPNILLWVEPADPFHPPGTVERLEDGLLRGFIDRFAPRGDATAISFECWLRVCARSHRLLRGTLPAAGPAPDALRIGIQASLTGCIDVTCAPSSEVPALQPDGIVFGHSASRACNNVAAVLSPVPKILPGRTYAGSLWVWVPNAFRGRLIAPVFIGSARGIVQPAILQERNRWQRIWVSGFMPDEDRVDLGIWADLDAGDSFYTTQWTIEQAQHPGCYLLDEDV